VNPDPSWDQGPFGLTIYPYRLPCFRLCRVISKCLFPQLAVFEGCLFQQPEYACCVQSAIITLGPEHRPHGRFHGDPLRMKIAYLLSEYPTLGHTYLLREVRELRSLGWEIQTVSIRKPDSQPASTSSELEEELTSTRYVLDSGPYEFLAAHLATVLTRPRLYLRGLATAWRFGRCTRHPVLLAMAYFTEAVVAGRWLRNAGFEHVHSVYSTTVGLILARVFGMTLSMTIHGPDEFVNPRGFGMEEKIRAALFASAISCFGKSQIMLWSSPADWHKLEITPLGIDCDGWVPAPFRQHPVPFKLISVGRLAPVKGYALLLKAVAILTAEQREVCLTLVGDGPERPQLAQQAQDLGIADRVLFAGWKTQAELRDTYCDSEACVLSSFAEGIPVVFMEAMALGIPCVAPRITGIPELIRDGVDGLLVTPANVDELAAAIGQIMDMPEMRRQMALSSRQRVLDKYNLRKNVAHLAEVFNHYAGKNGGSLGSQS